MDWTTFAIIHNIAWRVEEDPHLHIKVYRFKKEDKRIDYAIPHEVLRNITTYQQRKLLEAELLRVIKELV